jgi:hypothetical protein
MFSCNAASGQCVQDPAGSQSSGECIAACKCVIPHNCGMHNNTISCNAPITGCNVCDVCCKPYLTVQASCDGCFAAQVPNGCGNRTNPPTPAPTPMLYSCNMTTGQCTVDPAGALSPDDCIASCKAGQL